MTPVTVANTARDGSGTVELIYTVEDAGGTYVDRIVTTTLGTNAATESVVLISNGYGLTNPRNNAVLGNRQLTATTLGTALSTDIETFTVDAWCDEGTEFYALVHATQAAGRQFILYGDSTGSYQLY